MLVLFCLQWLWFSHTKGVYDKVVPSFDVIHMDIGAQHTLHFSAWVSHCQHLLWHWWGQQTCCNWWYKSSFYTLKNMSVRLAVEGKALQLQDQASQTAWGFQHLARHWPWVRVSYFQYLGHKVEIKKQKKSVWHGSIQICIWRVADLVHHHRTAWTHTLIDTPISPCGWDLHFQNSCQGNSLSQREREREKGGVTNGMGVISFWGEKILPQHPLPRVSLCSGFSLGQCRPGTVALATIPSLNI